ncbi:unnamed protein product [Phytophthora fragariaefolia]|uniref:Unnamed protein product n=1 Tax=Phytophthora fragariaefolia TaxID=1490495 RepID=A0A9W6XVL4_9STRA|nr:unnamed protein product [Phytophthora fragariaefolia]
MLAMLDEREVERRAEYAEFPRLPPSDDDVDEQDSPCPILDSWFNEVVFAFTLPGTGYKLARPTLHQDIEYPKIEVNPDAKIAWPGVCQPSFQPTARGSVKQGKAYTHPKATPGQDQHRPASLDQGTQDRQLDHTLAQRVEISPLLPDFPLPTRHSKALNQARLLRSPEARSSPPTDITMFRNNIEFHSSIRNKNDSDRSLTDGGPLVENFDDEWAMLADKGYQGHTDHTRCIPPKNGRNLSRADLQSNDDVSSDRVIVENCFGRLVHYGVYVLTSTGGAKTSTTTYSKVVRA